jgi:hypothetical protein
MKPKLLSLAFVVVISTLVFLSCKKSDSTPVPAETEIETTFRLSADQAIADNLTEDANDLLMSVAEEKNLSGNKGGLPETDNLICATVTVTPQSGFPKTVVIDFGPLPGCTAPNGITRSGKIQVVISDSLRHPQSTATMTFDNYHVNTYKIEGIITWKNTSTPGVRSWRREIQNGKITAADGRWWQHNGVKEIVQTGGVNTVMPNDDEFRITGHGNTINSEGRTRTHLITEPLIKKWSCEWIEKGKIRFEGPNHFSILDFGNGTCDHDATITIDGQTTHNIILP